MTLTCSLQARGHYSHSADDVVTASGSGAGAAVVAPTAFSVPAGDPEEGPFSVCGRADVTDADGVTTTWYSNSQNDTWSTGGGSCSGAPQCLSIDENCTWHVAFLDQVFGDPNVTALPDPLLCPALAGQSPGVPGVVDIDGTGDTYVAGTFVWDCPPYGP